MPDFYFLDLSKEMNMLRKLFLALTLLFSLSMILGQGLETFANMPATGSAYSDGTFTGQDGSTWTYVQSRSDFVITETALMLGRNRTPQSNAYSGTISGGIGTLSFDYMQAYSTSVNLNVLVNDVVVGNVTSAAQQATILQSGPITVNVLGDFVIKFINVNNSDGQVVIDNIAWTGYTGGSTPTISAIGTLSSFSTYTGTPSASQSYTLSGSSLTANISVVPPAGYAVSTDDTSFSGSLSLAPDFNGLVYVRLTGATAGTFDGNIVHTSTGAAQVDKAVTGTVTDPVPMINVTGTLNPFTAIVGTPSASQNYTLSGMFLTADIVVTPPAGFEVSTDNSLFFTSLNLASNYNGPVYVRLTGTTVGEYSGNIAHTSTGATQVDLAASGSVTEPLGPTTFIEENFAYTVGTTLVSNGWSAHSGAGTASPLVDAVNLVYPDYPPILGGSARTTGVTGEDVSKGFDQQNSGSIYVSWLMNITSLPNTTQDYNFHLGDAGVLTGGTMFRGRLYLQRNAENQFRVGISKGSTNTTVINWTGGPFTGGTFDYAMNTTYLMVMKYHFVEGAANDEVYLWINPAISPTEPVPTLFVGSTDTTSDPTNIGVVAIRQSNNTPAANYDGIRVTNDWALLWSGDVPPTPVLSVTGEPAYLYSIQGLPSDEPAEYQLSGTDLLGPITVTAPTHFEVSSTGADDWASQIQVADDFNGTIYVRLNSSVVGEQSGDVVNSSPGAENVTLRVEGEVLAPEVVWNITANLQPFAAEFEAASDVQSYSLSATNATEQLSVAVLDGAPFQISQNGTDGWTDALSLAPTFNGLIYVRMITTAAGDFNGVIQHNTLNAAPHDINVSGTVNPPAGIYATDLFFSEYIEGGSNNKALEIFNGTGVPVDLGAYKVVLYSNGASTPGNTLTFTPGTMLAHNDVYVIANSSANAAILALADVTSTVTYYNGDDAIALIKTVETVEQYVDIFGVIGFDPGTEWTADGGYSTLNKTLVRKPTITEGVSVNPVVTTFPTLATEWDVYPIDTIDYLGAHVFTPGAQIAEAPVLDPAGGVYSSVSNITMSTTTPNATIYYTTDGSLPSDTNGTVYTVPVQVSVTTTIKAITYATGFAPSSVTTETYVFPTLVSNIADLRAQATGTTMYKLSGEAVLTFQQTTRNQKYIQDATAAIVIDDPAGIITTAYNIYDGITGITGTLGTYSNLLQFTPVADPGAATSTGNMIVPELRTLASLTSDDQAKLIKVMNATLDATLVDFPAYAANIAITDVSGTAVLRTFPGTDYSGTPIPVDPVNVVGLVGQYNADMQISPRFLADFEAAGGALDAPLVTITQAGGQITLSWAAVTGATTYQVWASDDPYGVYTQIGTTPLTSFDATAVAKKFFYVKAIN